MKIKSSNHFKEAREIKKIFLFWFNYLATLGFVLVILLDEIISM